MDIESLDDIRWDNVKNSRKIDENKLSLNEYITTIQECPNKYLSASDTIINIKNLIENKIDLYSKEKQYYSEKTEEESVNKNSVMTKIERIYIEYLQKKENNIE